MNLRICLLWAGLILPQSVFSQISQVVLPIPDHSGPGAPPRVEMPFKLYGDYLIVVQGSIGTLKHLNFLIDTGVNPIAVDPRIAKQLQLTGGVHKLASFNQNTNVRQVVLPSLQLGPIQAESLPAMIRDLSSVEKVMGIRIDASIGFDVLNLNSFSIDYSSKKIVFAPIDSSPSSAPFDSGPPILTVQLQVQDEPVRLLVDTGAAELVLFECQLPGRLRRLPVASVRRFFNSAGKEVEMKELWLPSVRLGTTDFGPQKVLSVDDDANCGRPFDGVVGIKGLGLKWVAFDFEHRSFGWKR
jgi:predicted aspartyl protease